MMINENVSKSWVEQEHKMYGNGKYEINGSMKVTVEQEHKMYGNNKSGACYPCVATVEQEHKMYGNSPNLISVISGWSC